MKKLANIVAIILSLVLPVLGIVVFLFNVDIFIYNWLWCGLYGCILCKSKAYKFVAIILNLPVILLCAFGSLMGGFAGLLIFLTNMVIPFYSALI